MVRVLIAGAASCISIHKTGAVTDFDNLGVEEGGKRGFHIADDDDGEDRLLKQLPGLDILRLVQSMMTELGKGEVDTITETMMMWWEYTWLKDHLVATDAVTESTSWGEKTDSV